MGIDQGLDVVQLVRFDRAGMGKVETQAVRGHQGAGLADVAAQDLSEGGVHHVGGRVVEPRRLAPRGVEDETHPVAGLNRPTADPAAMDRQQRLGLLGIENLDTITPGGFQVAAIPHLTTRFTVKRGLGGDNLDRLALTDRAAARFSVDQHGQNLGFPLGNPVADKTGVQLGQTGVDVDEVFLALAGTAALLFHGPLKTVPVKLKPLGGQEVFGQVQREAVGIVQAKGNLPRQVCGRTGSQAADLLLQQGQAPAQGI